MQRRMDKAGHVQPDRYWHAWRLAMRYQCTQLLCSTESPLQRQQK
jgi:hypothetical protein